MRVSKITIGRLYNLGSYEHERFEIEVQVAEGQSAAEALIGVERILSALNPRCPVDRTELSECERRLSWTDEEWQRSRWEREPSWQKVKEEYAAKAKEMRAKLKAWSDEQAKVRAMLDDLGAASHYKDAKLDWEDSDGGDW